MASILNYNRSKTDVYLSNMLMNVWHMRKVIQFFEQVFFENGKSNK